MKLVLRAGGMGVNVPNMDQHCLSWDLDQNISNQHLGTLDAKLFGIGYPQIWRLIIKFARTIVFFWYCKLLDKPKT